MATAHPVQISIGATLAASLGSAVRGAQAQLNQLGSTMADLGNKQSGIKQLETLRSQAKDAALAMRAAQQKVSGLEANIANQGGEPSTKQTKELERARAAAAKAEESYRRQRAAVDELSTSLNRAGVNTRAMGAESAKLGSQLETLRTRTDALVRAQQSQAKNLEARSGYRAQMMDAVALGGALYGLVQPAVAFESVMADVKKVVNFDTPEQFGQMSKDVLMMSTRIPMAADGIGAIVAAAGQAGIAREELLRFAEDAAKMGVAFDLSGQQAGAAMTGLRSIFGLTQDEVVLLGDAVNHLSNNMDAKASDLLNIANRAGSTAKLFGLSGAQLNALGATFLALKTPPEVAATGINALLMKLATADKQNEKFQNGLEAVGLSAEVMKEMIGRDAQGAILTFLQQVKKAPDLMGTLSDLFGMEYADDIAKLVGSMDTYEKAVGLIGDQTAYAGSMQKEYESRSATTANALQLLKNQMSRLGITVGNALLPALNSLVGALMGPIDSLANLAERFPVVTQVVVGTIGAVLGLKVAAIGLGYAWTFVKGPILAANTAFQSARAGLALLQVQAAATGASSGILSLAWTRIQTGALGLIAPIKTAALAFWGMLPAIGATTAALLANPITWIVAGIGVAVAGLALVIRKYWDPIAAYVGGVYDGIRSALQPAITSLSSALSPLAPIGNVIAHVFGFIADAVSGLIGWVGQLLAPVTLTQDEFASLSASGQSLGSVIGGGLSAAFTVLTFPIRAVGTLVGWVIERFQALVAFLPLATISAAWQPVSGFFGAFWTSVINGAQSAWQQLTAVLGAFAPWQALQSVIGSMLGTLGNLPAQFMNLGSAMLQGLAQGVRLAAQQAVAAVGEVAAGLRDTFKSLLGINSPSRVFAVLGSALSLGLAQGVGTTAPAVLTQVGQLAESLQAVPLTLSEPVWAGLPLRPERQEAVYSQPDVRQEAPTTGFQPVEGFQLPAPNAPAMPLPSFAPIPEPISGAVSEPVFAAPPAQAPAASRPTVRNGRPEPGEVAVPKLEIGGEIARELGAVLPLLRSSTPDITQQAEHERVPAIPLARDTQPPRIPFPDVTPLLKPSLPLSQPPVTNRPVVCPVLPETRSAPAPQFEMGAEVARELGALLPLSPPSQFITQPPEHARVPALPLSQPSAASLPAVLSMQPKIGMAPAPKLEIGRDVAREIGAVLLPIQFMPQQPKYDERGPLAPVAPAPPIAPVTPMAATPNALLTTPHLPMAQSVPTQPTWQIHFAPQITIQAPAGSEPQAWAELLERRLRALLPLAIREATRSSNAAMYD